MSQSVRDLIEALEDIDDATREEAAKALAELGDPNTIDELLTAIEDDCWAVRVQIGWAFASTRLTAMSALKKTVLETLEKLGWEPLKYESDDQITNLQYTDPDKVLGEEGRFGAPRDARPAKGLKIER